MSINPLQLAFYKGMGGKHGAMQFNVQRPHYYCPQCKAKDYESALPKDGCCSKSPCGYTDKLKSREGALFLEICSTTGPNKYDWENKIIIALSLADMSKILLVTEGVTETVNIMHDPGAKTSSQGKIQKKLQISSPKGIREGCFVRAKETTAGQDSAKEHAVPLSADEMRALSVCLRHMIPASLSW